MRALVVVATAVAVAAGSANASAPARTSSCRADAVDAVVAGRHRCLVRFASCSARLNRGYHRYAFDCADGVLGIWWPRLRRPLRLGRLAPGAPCPADAVRGTLADVGLHDATQVPAFGPGPAYPTLIAGADGRAFAIVDPADGIGGWSGTKLLWAIPRRPGPVIVRGGRLDSAGRLRFDEGPTWSRRLHRELHFVGPEQGLHPAATYAQAPGCYAYQVDGVRFSYRIVFEVRVAASHAAATLR
jgi:hypothetical protein